jgi:hypothetical protein
MFISDFRFQISIGFGTRDISRSAIFFNLKSEAKRSEAKLQAACNQNSLI